MHIKRYLAHSPTEARPEGQPLKEHLEAVSQLSEAFCAAFSSERDGRLAGLYHDIGKYSLAFQRRLEGSPVRVDHSTAGALVMFDRKNIPVSMCIAGHHAGLSDLGTKNDLSESFMGRINIAKKGTLEDVSAWRTEISDVIPDGGESRPGFGNYFYIKMLFSALTDADWLDTEAYFQNQPLSIKTVPIDDLLKKLNDKIAPWWDAGSEINRRRCKILQSAIRHGGDSQGLFTMTVPTGGGKTVSSMAFALNHARENGLRRVIYVIPYCSILEQTQRIFEDIFGKENVTAHYSGAEFSSAENQEDPRVFSTENWEAPIILTTAVQFFESLYSNKPGKNRKLHNIAQSVIVFDEAQMLPVPFLRPCLAAICELVKSYGCSAVLCTATQPAVEGLLRAYAPEAPIRELCPEPEKMYQAFRRVRYTDDGELTDEALLERLRERRQVLCVVNSRRQAQALYRALGTSDGNFHLSTMLTPYDRRQKIEEIRARLRDGQDCRVISTSLIEAGVDVDFPEVYRALAGLDSIIQSGGRCNREGKRPAEESLVHIFTTSAKAPKMLDQNISAAKKVLRSFEDIAAPDAIYAYFHFLFYTLKGDEQLDAERILDHVQNLRFKSASEAFKLIEGADYTIYIPVGNGKELIQALRQAGPSRELLRKLGPYGVTVYRNYFSGLCDQGAVEMISQNAGILLDTGLYSPETGLPFTISEQSQALLYSERK